MSHRLDLHVLGYEVEPETRGRIGGFEVLCDSSDYADRGALVEELVAPEREAPVGDHGDGRGLVARGEEE